MGLPNKYNGNYITIKTRAHLCLREPRRDFIQILIYIKRFAEIVQGTILVMNNLIKQWISNENLDK